MNHAAPYGPGTQARSTSSAETGIGTALTNNSRVWFTLSYGIFGEVHYPSIGQACVRDMGLIITDGRTFFSEENATPKVGMSPSRSSPLIGLVPPPPK